jgi:hypothetical protein
VVSEEEEDNVGHYKVIFLGLAIASPEEEIRLLKGLQKRFNLSPQRAESLLQRVPIVVKKGTSREELEKYVRVFEEIGGKIRLEEEEGPFPEPQAAHREPSPTVPREVPESSAREALQTAPEAVPREAAQGVAQESPAAETQRMITCPQCGFEQPDTEICANCGITFSEYRPDEETARAKERRVRQVAPEGQRIAWESGEGFLGSFLKTVKECLFSPIQFYRRVANGNEYWSPLLYGIICNIIGSGVNILWAWYFWFTFSHYLPIPPLLRDLTFSHTAFKLISLPFLAAFFIFFYTAVVHVCLIIVGGNKSGFRSSFRAVSYAFSGDLLRIIPLLGSIGGWVYCLILAIIGARECHNISTGRAVLAVLLPLIVLIGFFILAVVFLPLFLGPTRFFGGVGV